MGTVWYTVLKRATRYFIRERAAYFTGFAFGKRVERLSSQTCKTSCRKFYFYLSNGLLTKQVSITQYKKLVTFCDLYEKVLWKYTRTLIISQTGTLFGLPHCWISSTIWVRLQHYLLSASSWNDCSSRRRYPFSKWWTFRSGTSWDLKLGWPGLGSVRSYWKFQHNVI